MTTLSAEDRDRLLPRGELKSKTQVHTKNSQEHPDSYREKTTYDLAYAYGETQPNAPIHIGDQTYRYDANGNQTGWTSDISGQERKILWHASPAETLVKEGGEQDTFNL